MLNFRYAVYSYLDEYLRVDKRCIDALELDVSPAASCEALSRMAAFYNINRNLATKDEAWRLEAVHNLLRRVQRPATDQEVAECVENFSIELGKAYPRKSGTTPTLLSAASKFLWMRFQSPVVMYDRYAWQWIKDIAKLRDTSSYAEYLQAWCTSFSDYKAEIAEACSEIVPFKRFTLAGGMADDQLRKLVQEVWFRERVFDHAIVEAAARFDEEKGMLSGK